MAKKKSEQAVLVLDDTASKTRALLQAQLEKMKDVSDSKYVGSTTITGIDIRTETSIPKLRSFIGEVLISEEAYYKGAAALGHTNNIEPFTIEKTSVATIIQNTKLRIAIIQQSATKEKLEKLVKEGEAFITQAEKKAEWDEKVKKAAQELMNGLSIE